MNGVVLNAHHLDVINVNVRMAELRLGDDNSGIDSEGRD